MAAAKSNLSRLFRQGDIWLIIGLFGTILLLILPVPPFLLDSLLATSIALSLLVVLVILYVRQPAEFTGFPTLLLFITLFRLALNVASTRLILLDGYAGLLTTKGFVSMGEGKGGEKGRGCLPAHYEVGVVAGHCL